MDISNTQSHMAHYLPASIDLVIANSADAWFAIAAIVTLWAYVMLAPGRREQEF